MANGNDRYGGFNLRRGDEDGQQNNTPPTWGGAQQAAGNAQGGGGAQNQQPVAPNAGGQGANALNVPQHVRQLQEDLRELGFLIAPEPQQNVAAEFDRRTEWAVREFQIYAKMDNVAQEDTQSDAQRYVDRLAQVANNQQYNGPISGVVNQDTRAAIQHWLDNEWRCPVVIEAWNMQGGNRNNVHTENIWLHDEVNTAAPRMYARDFSYYYTLPQGRNNADLRVVGDWQQYLRWNGPRSIPPRHIWGEGEILPEDLVGTPWAQLGGAQQSTFRVVRAVSEVECLGFFDSVNSYDNAFVSVGPCHWTLGIAKAGGNGAVSDGELCGYLAYLREVDQGAFDEAFGDFGARPSTQWNNNGANLFSAGSRKYAGWLEHQVETGPAVGALQTQWQDLPTAANQNAEDEANYFKTWHWFYRFVMAGRTIDGYRERMWHMARVRLRDIRNVAWGQGVANVGGNPATIGDVFTSERATAMILRLHIRGPAWVVSGGNAGARLTGALNRAQNAQNQLAWNGDPSQWTDQHEAALIAGLTNELAANASQGVQDTVDYVRQWANSWNNNPRGYALNLQTVGNQLDDTRNSFDFDASDLPPAPP